jgi:hypothetical protein
MNLWDAKELDKNKTDKAFIVKALKITTFTKTI